MKDFFKEGNESKSLCDCLSWSTKKIKQTRWHFRKEPKNHNIPLVQKFPDSPVKFFPGMRGRRAGRTGKKEFS